MVDGVHGYMDHAVKHVVVEQEMLLDSVTILNLHVEEMTAMVVAITLKNAMFVVLVRHDHEMLLLFVCTFIAPQHHSNDNIII